MSKVDLKLLSGKNVLIIGGAGLLGKVICEAVMEAGATCAIADISIQSAKVVQEDLEKKYNSKPMIFEVSIINTESVKKMILECNNEMGRIDILINTAYPRNKNYGRTFENVDYQDFCENVNLHLGGYFLVSQQILEYFKSIGGGVLLNMSSIYGVMAPRFEVYQGTPMTMPVEYAAIKSALIHLTKYMAKYYAGNNIRVNSVSLGGLLDKQPETFINSYSEKCINKGMLEPKDIIGTIVFLISDMAEFINGQNIIVDDGYTL